MGKLNLNYYYGKEAEQFTFYRLPKALITDPRFKGVSNNAKLLYGLLLDRMSLSAKSGWYDEENRVYIKYTIKSIMSDLAVGKDTAANLLKELEEIGLIDIDRRTGISSIIYVKNFISADTAVEKEDQTEKSPSQDSRPGDIVDQSGFRTGSDCRLGEIIDQSENASTGSRNTSVVLGENVAPSNKEDNNIELNNTNHIYLSKDTMQEEESIDEMEKINQEALVYMDIIRGNIEYDIMMSDKHWSDREMYDELYEIICDVVCVPKKFVRIGGENYPYSLVKSKFLKLNSSHLQYVIGCVKNNTTKVSNIRAYLITALYNAPNTMGHYYTSQVNHDMFGVG